VELVSVSQNRDAPRELAQWTHFLTFLVSLSCLNSFYMVK